VCLAASQLILGSSSVARKHILEEMGLEFQVMVRRRVCFLGSCRSVSAGEVLTRFVFVFVRFQTADIDEKSIRRENPDDLVMVLAEAKVGSHFPAFYSYSVECTTM